ncbi:MAG: Nramp family divalent metal transporter [Candidatus Paceibacterota bacterium]|jgi:NRAMP (natural resistance-associated macrophage protein)-like metal ion transporter
MWWYKLGKAFGPGLITGASDDDPSAVTTYSQAGASFGYTQLWTAFYSLPLLIAVQEMSARIGLASGRGIAYLINQRYSKPIVYGAVLILCITNIVTIGADLGAMASAAQLIVPAPFWLLILGMTLLIVILEVAVSYKQYVRFLKYLTLFFIAYIVTAFLVNADWGLVMINTFIPKISFNETYWLSIIAILGATISPYAMFWQADEEVEEGVAHYAQRSMTEGVPNLTEHHVKHMRIDTVIGMLFANLIMFFVILTTGATIGQNGGGLIENASQAASVLVSFGGSFTPILFALGIIGIGLLAIPILAGSAAYAVAEVFGWKEGLYLNYNRAKGFYGVIIVATIIGLCINFSSIQPFRMLYYASALNGVLAVPLLIMMVHIANDKKIMGTHINSSLSNVVVWLTIAIMCISSVLLVVSYF